jgi:amidase
VGPAWSEAKLLAYGYAFEQAAQWRREPQFLAQSSMPPLGESA